MAFLAWNGVELPSPAPGLTIEGQQFVTEARNALGEWRGQKINRRQTKISGITWNWLTAAEWAKIRKCIEEFSGSVTYFDDLTGKFITRKMYWGDVSVQPYWTDKNGNVLNFTKCTCSLIDMGLED